MKLKDILFYTALTTILIIVFCSLFSDFIAPHDPLKPDLNYVKMPPSFSHPMGTDDRGRDVLSRIMSGGKFSLAIGIISTVCALSIGITLGFIGGYFGGIFDSILGFMTNITFAFPSLLLAIGLSSIMRPGFKSVIITLSAISWAGFSRLIRGETLKHKNSNHIEAARALGANQFYILIRHILPLCSGIIITASTLQIGVSILTESSLSFLGLGLQPPDPTWGGMVSQGRDYFRSAPWITLFPGAVITITILCFNIVGEQLRSRFGRKFDKSR